MAVNVHISTVCVSNVRTMLYKHYKKT